jgi:hypothetical protein
MVLVRFALMLNWNLEVETQLGVELLAKEICGFLRGKIESTDRSNNRAKTSYRNWLNEIVAQRQPALDHVEQDEEGYDVLQSPFVL